MSSRLRVLYCDDSGGALRGFQQEVAAPLEDILEPATASSLEGFEALANNDSFDVVISDLNFEHVGGGPKDGLLILRSARSHWPEAELLLVTAFTGSLGVEEGLELAAQGLSAENLFSKTEGDDPAQVWSRLRERLRGIWQSRQTMGNKIASLEQEGFFHRTRALEETIEELADKDVEEMAPALRARSQTCFQGIVGQSFRVHEVLKKLERAARRQSDVLILGETGTGKELLARGLHACSPRADGPFVKTDIAALSRELIPAELFGHEKGAFTGAQGARRGLIAEADGGILFLDEIGNLGGDVQSGLLRFLEDRCYRPLGASKDRQVDVVVLAATNQDLEQAVKDGNFRGDLLERLHVVELSLPPLHDRREDIPLLAVCFLADLRKRFQVPGFSRFEAGALEALARHPWPRNVRQLRNTIERLFSELEDDTDPITAAQVQRALPDGGGLQKSLSRRVLDGEESLTLAQLSKRYGEDAVREVIRDAFLELRGPPDDELAAKLFGDMKANTWRQFAFKRGLTYKSVLRDRPE